MTNPQQFRYRQRFDIVVDYIHKNLDMPLTLEVLAKQAFFSPCHFQRQFYALYGVSTQDYINQLRMQRSAYQLAFRPSISINEIAFDNNYQSQAAFSRAFKRHLQQSPLKFRKSANWSHSTLTDFSQIKTEQHMTTFSSEQVSIHHFESTEIAQLTHVGPAQNLMASITTFIKWRSAQPKASRPPISDTYNIIYDDPSQVAPEQYRFGIACSVSSRIDSNSNGVTNAQIPAGRCAKILLTGRESDMGDAINFLYRHWLVDSGEEPRDFPLFVKRIAMFPDVAPHLQEFEVYLPIK